MDANVLFRHRCVWEKKPILQLLYRNWYEQILSFLCAGPTVELGAGSGNLKQYFPKAISTDIVSLPWLDLVVDSQYIPFKSSSIGNIILFDVLHHIRRPHLFLNEVQRVLQPKGRLIIMDPYISWVSWVIYRFFHPEPVEFRVDPFDAPFKFKGYSSDANQAISTIFFEKAFNKFQERYPNFHIRAFDRMAFFAYPLSGGFSHPSLIPLSLVKPLLALEQRMSFLAGLCAFRLLVVLEKVN